MGHCFNTVTPPRLKPWSFPIIPVTPTVVSHWPGPNANTIHSLFFHTVVITVKISITKKPRLMPETAKMMRTKSYPVTAREAAYKPHSTLLSMLLSKAQYQPAQLAGRQPPSTLLNLPTELIYEVADLLPLDAILALKLTHRVLDNTLDLRRWAKKKKPLTSCTRLAIRTYLAEPDPSPTQIRCILCKTVYPSALFSSSSSPMCIPVFNSNNSSRSEIIELPPRFCAWHVGRLTKVVHTGEGGKNGWVSRRRRMCMHCGEISSWGGCQCDCDSCGTCTVQAYIRYLNNKTECRKFKFYRDAKDQLRVKETCWEGECSSLVVVERTQIIIDATQPDAYAIDVPVHFELERSSTRPSRSHTVHPDSGRSHFLQPHLACSPQ
ncbi:hypothetical protein M011DRAFT_114598 [Sporormia fimetaria CBS 119925]|uniref:F-box domain-containing protein n=1 Tax=Sporormia fimetaria CBS 119925 TaxID=1340428 RepID=A0A6A6VQF0_9PLEO|nr:hypothetical protein M011DRAFT_114598 [Sporormia fimetaria CBS 119925]